MFLWLLLRVVPFSLVLFAYDVHSWCFLRVCDCWVYWSCVLIIFIDFRKLLTIISSNICPVPLPSRTPISCIFSDLKLSRAHYALLNFLSFFSFSVFHLESLYYHVLCAPLFSSTISNLLIPSSVCFTSGIIVFFDLGFILIIFFAST